MQFYALLYTIILTKGGTIALQAKRFAKNRAKKYFWVIFWSDRLWTIGLHKSLLSQKATSNRVEIRWMPEWWDFLWFTFKHNIRKLEKSWCSQPDSVDFEFFSAAHAHASHESKAVHIPSIHWTLNYLGGTCMNQKLYTFWAFIGLWIFSEGARLIQTLIRLCSRVQSIHWTSPYGGGVLF